MARRRRIDFEGAVHHVINRGTAQTALYRSDRDRRAFIECLGELEKRFGVELHALALMSNHYHLVVRSTQGRVSEAMQWLDGSYAQLFNWRHGRVGALYQGRFTSRIIDDEAYLETVAHYVHLNPVGAGVSDHPAEYRWSSLPSYVGRKITPEWLHTDLILSDRSPEQFLRATMAAADLGAGHGPVFVEPPAQSLDEARFAHIERKVAEALGASTDEIHAFCRGARNPARTAAIVLSSDTAGIDPTHVVERYGLSSPSSIRRARQRFERVLAEHPQLRRLAQPDAA